MDIKSLYAALKCCKTRQCGDCPKNAVLEMSKNRCRNGLLKDCYEFIGKLLEEDDE
jgi:hypothetical protein